MQIGKNIQKIRKRKGILQEDLAAKIGTKRAVISKYETGIIKNIPISKLNDIAKALDVDVADLFDWKDADDDINLATTLAYMIDAEAEDKPEISDNKMHILELLEGLSDESIAKLIDYAKLLKMAEGENE